MLGSPIRFWRWIDDKPAVVMMLGVDCLTFCRSSLFQTLDSGFVARDRGVLRSRRTRRVDDTPTVLSLQA
jgi:hypothetical protein